MSCRLFFTIFPVQSAQWLFNFIVNWEKGCLLLDSTSACFQHYLQLLLSYADEKSLFFWFVASNCIHANNWSVILGCLSLVRFWCLFVSKIIQSNIGIPQSLIVLPCAAPLSTQGVQSSSVAPQHCLAFCLRQRNLKISWDLGVLFVCDHKIN